MGGRSRPAESDADVTESPITLRSGTPQDLPAMARIERASFSDPWSARAFEGLLASPTVSVRVAVCDGSVVGYSVVVAAADQGELANIAVDPAWRRRGVAVQLLRALLDEARATGVTALFLEVRETNVAAQALYAQHAFQPVGRRRGYYQQPREDALVLRWTDPAAAAP